MILGEIEARAAEDVRRRQDGSGPAANAEARWRAAVEVAKEQAVREQLAQALRDSRHASVGRGRTLSACGPRSPWVIRSWTR